MFNSDNSPLPVNESWISNLFVDKDNNIWFAFYDNNTAEQGLACFNENGITNTANNNVLPTRFHLAQNYPNPFNPSTEISFSIAQKGNVKLIIYNSLGQEVGTLVNKQMEIGNHSVEFNAENLPSGVYLYQILTSSSYSEVKKMILLK